MLEMGTLWCNWQHVFVETIGNCKENGKKTHPSACPEQGHVTDGPSSGRGWPVTWHRPCHQGQAKLPGWKIWNTGLDLIQKVKSSGPHDLQHNLQYLPGVKKSWNVWSSSRLGRSCPCFVVPLREPKGHLNILLWVCVRAGWGCCQHHSLHSHDLLLSFKCVWELDLEDVLMPLLSWAVPGENFQEASEKQLLACDISVFAGTPSPTSFLFVLLQGFAC